LQLERYSSLVEMFFVRARAKGSAPFLWHKADGAWQPIGWDEVARRVASLAAALRGLGLRSGDRVMLVAENRPEWAIADLAIMAAGCVTVPAYTSNTERDHTHIVENSGARAAIVSTARLARPLLPALASSGLCHIVIGMEPLPRERIGALRLYEWQDLLLAHPADVEATAAAANFQREDIACLIYTSGTGGSPRGVRQHHGAILHNVAGAMAIIGGDFPHEEEVFLSFLPLSHSYEHSAGLYLPIGLGAEIYYAESLEKLGGNIEEVRPTIMIVVPRLFELLRARISKGIEKQGKFALWLLARALDVDARPGRLIDRPLDLLLDATIRKSVRKRFGGRMKALVSGGAPLNPDVGRFFRALGLTLLQGYGQTEAGPIVSVNRPRAGIAMESVGPPMLDTEVRIADDGEILVRGENVMHGYWDNEEESARVLIDGWLHTGDVGRIDEAGRIHITDRKKDLIVNDKGDNISPQRVEGILTLERAIAQAMVVGDRRPLSGRPDRARQGMGRRAAAGNTDLQRAVMAVVDRVNAGLSVTEKVRRVLIADEPFTIENGSLTPSLKVRRHVLRALYGDRLDALYTR
jgi:long-chain acyl-CoA synthetase